MSSTTPTNESETSTAAAQKQQLEQKIYEGEAEDIDYGRRSAKIEESVKQLGQRLSSLKMKRSTLAPAHPDIDESLVSTNEPAYTSTPVLTPVKEHERAYDRSPLSTTGSEKLLLMRKQLEENKARFARRSTNNQQLLQLVTKVKEKMGVTQQSLIETTELRRSMTDLTSAGSDANDPRERHRSATDLSARGSINIDRERNKFLENRVRLLEKQLNKERSTVQQAYERIKNLEQDNEQLRLSSETETSLEIIAESQQQQKSIKDAETDAGNDDQVKLEMAKQIQELQHELEQLHQKSKELEREAAKQSKLEVSDNMVSEKLNELERTVESLREQLEAREATIGKQTEEIAEKTIELNILNANVNVLEEKLANSLKNKPLFAPSSADDADLKTELQQLKQKLDENNKAMIKLKLKCKQYEKQLQKQSPASSEQLKEIERQSLIIEELQGKISELEDEKGQWQLTQVDDNTLPATTTTSTTIEVDKQQTEAIRLLEEQKLELQEELQTVQQEKDAARVKSELAEAHMEEQLTQRVLQLEAEHQDKLQGLEKKLSHYISENMELLEKIDKLSKSSSSAESIEIVERLTQQERAELDEFNKRLTQGESDGEEDVERDATIVLPSLVSELTQTDIALEVSESLEKLREESTELKNKIELFTNERREVLDKMEHLTAENAGLTAQLEELTAQKAQHEIKSLEWSQTKSKLEKELQETEKENEQLSLQVSESSAQRARISQELTSLQKSSEVVAALDTSEGATLFDKCEKSLSKLNSELEAYRKANDQKAKFNVSKKLAKEAKNVHTQLSELLQKVKEASNAVETVTVVETVVAVTAPNGKALAEYEQLTAQNTELKAAVCELQRELETLRESCEMGGSEAIKSAESVVITDNKELERLHEELSNYEQQCIALQSTVEDLRLKLTESSAALEENSQMLSNEQRKNSDLWATIVDLERGQQTDSAKEIDNKEVEELRLQISDYEERSTNFQIIIDELREQLRVVRTEVEEKTQELNERREEDVKLNKQIEEYDRLINDKEMAHEKQIEQLTRVRHELEGKCETYEGEMAILQTLIAEQKQQLIEAFSENEHKMNLKLLELQQYNEEITQLRADLSYAQRNVVGEQLTKELSADCDTLRESLKISKALAAQQVNELSNKQETIDTLNQQIIDLYKTMEENANQLFEKEGELESYKSQLDEQRQAMENLRKGNEEQKKVVDKLLEELHTHRSSMPQLEAELQRLKTTNVELTELNKNLELRAKENRDKLKKYAANLKKRTAEYQELEARLNSATVEQNVSINEGNINAERESLLKQIAEHEQSLTTAKSSIVKLNEELKHKIHANLESRDAIKNLKHQLKEKTEELFELREKVNTHVAQVVPLQAEMSFTADQTHELNEKTAKILQLEVELRTAVDDLHRKNNELSALTDNSNQLNLKVQHLVDSLALSERTVEELKNSLKYTATPAVDNLASEQMIEDLKRQLESKSIKFEKSKEVIKHRNVTIQSLQRELNDLRDKLNKQPEELVEVSVAEPLKQDFEKLYEQLQTEFTQLNERYASEKTAFEQTTSRLETLHDGIQAKLQEDMSYIESLENDNAQLKTKMTELEESVRGIQDQKYAAGERVQQLEAQLNAYTQQSERNEEDLISRVNTLSKQDEALSRNLLTAQKERDELKERLNMLQADYNNLSAKHERLVHENRTERANLETTIASETEQLREQMLASEKELERLRAVYDAKLAAKATEVDELECELSEHMDRVNAEKRALAEQLEKAQDDSVSQMDEIVRLRESVHMLEQAKIELERESTWLRLQQESAEQDQIDLQELRMQYMQDKTETDNLRNQIETFTQNHDQELQSLRQQLADLDTLGQNQTDDQVFIETENKRLTDLLAEKQAVIESYERGSSTNAAELPVSEMQRQLADKSEIITRLQHDLHALQTELANLRQAQLSVAVGSASDIIAAPSIFFDNDQATPSPFDEIVQPRSIASQLGAAMPPPPLPHVPPVSDLGNEQATIEDLQRNVSDLEKHAQDLETKLAARNQLVAEYEERMREYHQNLQQAERLQIDTQRAVDEREAQLRNLAAIEDEVHASQQRQILELSTHQAELEALLNTRQQEILQLKAAQEESERLYAINQQIQQSTTTTHVAQAAPTLDMFFGTGDREIVTDSAEKTSASSFLQFGLPQDEPVVEEIIRPKSAYVCHPSEAAGDWGVDDDPWASAAAGLQETPVIYKDQTSTQLAAEIEQQAAHIKQLEFKLETAEQQKQELQLKSAKLMKKLKELKTQVSGNQQQQQQQQLSVSTDLDMAICDELRRQVELLEAQLSEVRKANETETLEKDKLKKRIDVLTAGNDRMSEMKEKQDRDVQMYQARIRELQEQLNKLNDWGGELATAAHETTATTVATAPTAVEAAAAATTTTSEASAADVAKIAELQAEIQDLNVECQELQAMLSEEKSAAQRAQEAVNALQQQIAADRDTDLAARQQMATEKDTLKAEINRLIQEEQQLHTKITTLQLQIEELQSSQPVAQEPSEELQELRSQREEFLLAEQRAAEAQKNANEYVAQLQEKESEIIHLKQRVEDLMREDQTEKLVLEILTKNQEIHMLKLQLKQLNEDKLELLQAQKSAENVVPTPVVGSEAGAELEIEKKLLEAEAQNRLLEQEKTQMEEELRVLNDHVMSTLDLEEKVKSSVVELDMKNIEIAELRKSLEALQNSQQNWEQLAGQQCSELAQQWQEYINQREVKFKNTEKTLQDRIDELLAQLNNTTNTTPPAAAAISETPVVSTAAPGTDVNTLEVREASNTNTLIADMKKVLEEQEVEIVTLKEQLAIRSAEYGRLAAQYDPFKLQYSMATGHASNSEDLQKKLDRALYMLHERDMRCEEMTVELGQLLNERDTLQLKLSDTLRQVETIRAQTQSSSGVSSEASTTVTTAATAGIAAVSNLSTVVDSLYKNTAAFLATGTSPVSGTNDELNQKLSQLQTVNHSKDKAIVEEREQRERDMGQLQKDVANLPLANISSQSVDMDTSQTNRSPSTVLFNWLMGGSGKGSEFPPQN